MKVRPFKVSAALFSAGRKERGDATWNGCLGVVVGGLWTGAFKDTLMDLATRILAKASPWSFWSSTRWGLVRCQVRESDIYTHRYIYIVTYILYLNNRTMIQVCTITPYAYLLIAHLWKRTTLQQEGMRVFVSGIRTSMWARPQWN